MGIQIKWDCNLDRAASHCLPRYSFRRLDTRDLEHNVSPGYNFRYRSCVGRMRTCGSNPGRIVRPVSLKYKGLHGNWPAEDAAVSVSLGSSNR